MTDLTPILRDFDNPDLTIGELARPLSALEVSPRAAEEFFQRRLFGGQGAALGNLRTADAEKIRRDVRARLIAEKKWEAVERRLRAKEVVQC